MSPIRVERRPLPPWLPYLVWRNGQPEPRAVALFATREHAEWCAALLKLRDSEPAAYLVADLREHQQEPPIVHLVRWSHEP